MSGKKFQQNHALKLHEFHNTIIEATNEADALNKRVKEANRNFNCFESPSASVQQMRVALEPSLRNLQNAVNDLRGTSMQIAMQFKFGVGDSKKRKRDGEFNKFGDDQMKSYNCVYCKDTNNRNFPPWYETIEEVHDHWIQEHAKQLNAFPFLFYIIEKCACFYCGYYGTFSALKNHYNEKHGDDAFVIVNFMNRLQCAICHFENSDSINLIDHFKNEHSYLLQGFYLNPICWSEEVLNRYRSIDLYKKIQCGQCNTVYETEHQFRTHHAEIHGGLEQMPNKIFSMNLEYIICFCEQTKINPKDYFQHFEKHLFDWKCSMCTRRFKNVDEMARHCRNAHNDDVLRKTMTDCKERMIRDFRRVKFVFGNGLVATTQNLLNTTFNGFQHFVQFVEKLLTVPIAETQIQMESETFTNNINIKNSF